MTHDVPLEPATWAPRPVAGRSRLFGPALGVIVAIISFGFGGSLAARPPPGGVGESEEGVARPVSTVIRTSGREVITRLALSTGSNPPTLTLNGLVEGPITAVRIRVSDRDGRVLATSIAGARALPSVIASSSAGNGLAAITATLALPPDAALDPLIVDLIAR